MIYPIENDNWYQTGKLGHHKPPVQINLSK